MFQTFITDNDLFKVWSSEHWIWLLYAVISLVLFVQLGRKSDFTKQTNIGGFISMIGVIVWVIVEIVMFSTNQAPLSSTLPFHLCFFLNLLLPFVMYGRRFAFFDVIYPLIMAGCLQALFTPDLTTAFPGYYSLRYWFVHIGLVQCILYAVFVYKWRPTIWSVPKALLFCNVYMLFVYFVNSWLGTNFMYLNKKPPGSILDYLGEHYLLYAQLLAAVFFFIVWLPFAFKPKSTTP